MIITDDKQEVSIEGAQSVSTFKIKASSKAFQILSASLYSNKLGSMIRELSTNAYDAHVMNNKQDVPFHITLPNSLEPTFNIRDFGPGISPEDIVNVYTVIFESTKTNSNDMVGCLGLGSKSPFGIADSFTVTSYYNNKKTIYSAFLDSERIPCIAKFAEFDTDEPTGLEIEIAINANDFKVFNREVNSQLKYFTVKPLVFGNEDFSWNLDEEYLYQGTNWKMVKSGNYGARVVQGQISYPISPKDMGAIFENAPDTIKEILYRPILFTVNIGDVNIAPSREALTYDLNTCNNIIKYAQVILDELPEIVSQTIQSAPFEYQARLIYDTIAQDFKRGYYSRNILSTFLESTGKILWHDIDVSSVELQVDQYELIGVTSFTRGYNHRYQKQVWSPYKTYDYILGKYSDDDSTWNFTVTPLNELKYIIVYSTDKSVEARTKQFANDHKIRKVYLITTDKTIDELAPKWGLLPEHFMLASDLPKVRREPREKSDEKTIFVQEFNKNHWTKNDAWTTITVDTLKDLKGFYVNLDNRTISDSDGKIYDDLKSIVSGAADLKLLDPNAKIYGLRKQNQSRPHKLKCLFTYIKKQSKKISVGIKYDFGDHNEVFNKLTSQSEYLSRLLELIPVDSPIKNMIDIAMNHKTKFGYDASKLIRYLHLTDKTIDVSSYGEMIDHNYNIIPQLGYYMNPKIVASYITQIDALIELKNILPRC